MPVVGHGGSDGGRVSGARLVGVAVVVCPVGCAPAGSWRWSCVWCTAGGVLAVVACPVGLAPGGLLLIARRPAWPSSSSLRARILTRRCARRMLDTLLAGQPIGGRCQSAPPCSAELTARAACVIRLMAAGSRRNWPSRQRWWARHARPLPAVGATGAGPDGDRPSALRRDQRSTLAPPVLRTSHGHTARRVRGASAESPRPGVPRGTSREMRRTAQGPPLPATNGRGAACGARPIRHVWRLIGSSARRLDLHAHLLVHSRRCVDGLRPDGAMARPTSVCRV